MKPPIPVSPFAHLLLEHPDARLYHLRVGSWEDAGELLCYLEWTPDTLLAFNAVVHRQPSPGVEIEFVSTLDMEGVRAVCRQCEHPAPLLAALASDSSHA